MFNQIFWFVLLHLIIATNTKRCSERRCKITRIHGLKVADCYQKEIKSIPQCLPDDLETIDLSYNRIRKINKDDLNRYSYLKILYLSDNMINSINSEAFRDLSELITLDLTMNSIQKLPPAIFQLPSLKSLYLGQNLNINIIDAIEDAKPIKSPLAHLDISFLTDEEPIEFPNFHIITGLIKLNVTGNYYENLTPKHFAGLCNLKYLENLNVTTDFDNECDCWSINHWLKERKVHFIPFPCTGNENRCLLEDLNEDDLNIYNKCLEEFEEIKTYYKVTKILIILGSCFGIVLIVVGVILLYRIKQKKKNQILSSKLDTSSLIQMRI